MNYVFDERYDIRQAHYDEIDEIRDFIDKYWKKGHILSKNRELFEYEYVIDGKVNFYIAKNKFTGELESIQGFAYASQNKNKRDIWGSMSKTRTDHPNMPFLNRELIIRLIENMKARYEVGVGVNPRTMLVLSQLDGYYCHKMNHYYRLADKNDYKIAQIQNKTIINKDNSIVQIQPKIVKTIDELKRIFDFETVNECIPYKDEWYINHRFFKYPFYHYMVYSVEQAFFVIREQESGGEKILRIMDYIGKHSSFGKLYDFFTELLKNYEYVDFYNYGFEDEYLKQAGFVNKEKTPENIIPNYFSPFVQENIDIYVHSQSENTLYFKADADQDRPN